MNRIARTSPGPRPRPLRKVDPPGIGVLCVVVTSLVLQAQVVHAGGDCFDFATPAVERLLDKDHVQRMVILVRIPGQQAKQAAESLAHEAKKRGIEPITISATQPPAAASTVEETARLCKDNAAQLMATVQYVTSGRPPSATIELRDTVGQIVETTVSCRPEQHWYGWQLILADAIVFSALFASGGRTSSFPAATFTAPYLFVPPLLHAANGQWDRIPGTFVLRLVPFVAVFAVAEAGEDPGHICLVFAALVSLYEDIVLAWKPATATTPPTETRPVVKSPGLSFNIGVLPYRQGAGIGLAGRF